MKVIIKESVSENNHNDSWHKFPYIDNFEYQKMLINESLKSGIINGEEASKMLLKIDSKINEFNEQSRLRAFIKEAEEKYKDDLDKLDSLLKTKLIDREEYSVKSMLLVKRKEEKIRLYKVGQRRGRLLNWLASLGL